MKTKKIYIEGMHCVSCERLLGDEFKKIGGVRDVKVDCRTNVAEIKHDGKFNFSGIKKIAQKFGYDAFEEKNQIKASDKKANIVDWVKAIGIVASLVIAYRIMHNLGIVGGIDFRSDGVTIGVSLLLGLTASVSSCLAIVGAVVIAFGEKYKSDNGSFYNSAVKPNIFFHIGRLTTFFILGGLLGLIGAKVNISGNLVSIFTITVSVVMFWMGLNILGILPSISKLGIRIPRKFSGNWKRLKESEHKAAPFFLGGISFFLPCGFTQSMQIFAVASGSFWVGGISLLVFALGTVPSLLALGITASWTRSKKIIVWQKVAGFLVIMFAIFTFNTGWALKGVDSNVFGSKPANRDNKEIVEKTERYVEKKTAGEQVIEMRVTKRGFEPSVLRIKKDIPVKWVIHGDFVSGCSNNIIVPQMNISKDINRGENIVRFVPKGEENINFSCWMGMIRGKFIVE